MIKKRDPKDFKEKRDPKGNYLIHEVPKELYVAVKELFRNNIFARKDKRGVYLIKTHVGQRKVIRKYLNINLK